MGGNPLGVSFRNKSSKSYNNELTELGREGSSELELKQASL